MDPREWIERYRVAWERADAPGAAALFTEHGVYRSHPFREPERGRDGVEAYWRRVTETQRDARVRFGHPIVDGRRVAVEWWTTMHDDGPVTLPGVLVLRFDERGLCEELRECWAYTDAIIEPFEGWGEVGGNGADGAAGADAADAREAAPAWIEGYTRAWRALDAEAVAPLFSDDVVYRSHPFRPPRHGRAGALAYTREAFEDEQDIRPRFGRPVCAGSAAAVEYWAVVREGGVPSTLAGCDVIRFDRDGRCRELREVWHLEPGEREPPPGWGE